MRVVVTGGSGHIGRAIVEELLHHGHEVRVGDRLPLISSKASFQETEMEDFGQVISLLADCDALIHAAAIPRPGAVASHVLFRTNMIALFHALEACRLLKIRRFVWTSSMSVLGYPFHERQIRPHYLPFDEAHPHNPQEAYALSKALGEQLVASYSERCGLLATSLRIVWAHTPETFQRDLLPFWKNPAAGASNLWSYIDTRDCGLAARLALECQVPGHHALFLSAADTCMPIPTRQLVTRYMPDAPEPSPALAEYGALFDTSAAHTLLGFEAQHSWEEYGFGTRASFNTSKAV